LQRSLVISATLGIFSVAVIVTVATIAPLYEYLKKEERRTLLLALTTKTTAVEEYLARTRDVAKQMASRTMARKKLAEYNNGQASLEELQSFTKAVLADAMEYAPEVYGISRFDAKGNLVVQVGLDIPPEFITPRTIRSKETLLHGPVALAGRSYIGVQAPIIESGAERVGTDLVLFRLFQLQRIIEDYTGLGTTGEAVIGVVHGDRVDLVFPFRRAGTVRSVSSRSALGTAFLRATADQTGVMISDEAEGENEVIAYGPVRGCSWGMVLKMARDELYAPINRQIWATSNIIVILIMLATVGMMLLVRPLAGKTIMHADELEKEIEEKTASLQTELNERKRIERWLRDSERRYHMLIENVPDVLFILDEDGAISYVNTQIESFLDCPVQQILDTRLQDHIVPDDRARVEAMFHLRFGSVFDDEVGILSAKGAVKYARIRCKASRMEENGAMRYEGVMRDITRRRLLEKELKASRVELLEKIRIIDDLYEHIVQSRKAKAIANHTAEVAHELRQPLAIIGGFARRMHRQIESGQMAVSAQLRETCGIIIGEIQRLERILDSLIDFTRHERIKLVSADPNEIIERVLTLYAGRMNEKNLDLQANLGKEVGEVYLDPNRFEQVVRDLISNALEASPRRGCIELETGVSIPSGRAQEAGALEAETYFEMKIRNNGRVIPDEELQKIFNPFYTTKDYGTGIGLTLSKRIVEDHHGSISVKSDEKGTQFTVWLPLRHSGVSNFAMKDAANLED